jgi:hypothetical protein
MKYYLFLIILGVNLILASSPVFPQQSRTLFFMHNVPQAFYVNPAVQPTCKYFIGFPLLSSVYLNASSTGFAYNDFVDLNPQSLVRGLHGVDFLTAEAHINLIALGYKHKDFYFSFNIAEKIDVKAFFPESLIDLAVDGNEQLIGRSIATRGIGANLTHLREYSLGVSQQVSPYYSWGIRGKLLFGKANITTRPFPIIFTTNENSYDLFAEWGFQVNSSVPLNVDNLPNGQVDGITLGNIDPVSYLLNGSNYGFAVDYGFIYEGDPFTWSASVLDLGAIYWQSDSRKFTNSGSFAFSGLNINDVLNSNDFLIALEDSLQNQLRVREVPNKYLSLIPFKINVGATYPILPKINAGLLFRTEFYPRRPVPSLTLSLNTQKTQWFFASVNYSVMNGSYSNFGIGLGFRAGSFGVHMLTDNVLAFIKPQTTHTANFRFGLDFVFGCTSKFGKLKYNGPGCFWDNNNQKGK